MITDGIRSSVQPAGTYRLSSVVLVLVGIAGVILLTIDQPRHVAAAQQTDKLKDPQFVVEGAKLFAPSCGNAYCHGTGGVGGGAPRLRGRGLESAYLFKTISNGIPGSSMLSFKSELSEEQIWKLVAFVMSDVNVTPDTKAEAPGRDRPSTTSPVPSGTHETKTSSSIAGSAQAGKALFFDSSQSKSCHHCHSLQGEGTSIGPDLSNVSRRSPRELFLSVILPREVKDSRYATTKLTLRSGDTIIGIKKEEDAESLRIYDTTELPSVLRTIQKTDVTKVENQNESVMPTDYASLYTMKQLLDLVTFLKSLESKSPVMLRDLLE